MKEHERLDPELFLASIAASPEMLEDPQIRERRDRLLSHSSVCSYCGVGCPYTVEHDARGRARVYPLSPLGLCVKGRTSLMTGGDRERSEKLERRGLPDDRIRAPMIRGHDGKMREVSWDEALDRAAWLFLHAREWVGPEAVAVYGNGQKTIEAIWMASLYKLVFKLPTIGANSEHCLASAGAAHELNFGNEASFTWQQYEELAHCDVAVLHGTNAYVTFPQAYEKLKRNSHAIKVVIDPVRMVSAHGVVVAQVSHNDRIATGTAFIDFVPGEVNRLTDYVEADQFTHQSLIKRTPVRLEGLSPLETTLWREPDSEALAAAIDTVFADWRSEFASDEEWLITQREDPDALRWLPPAQLTCPTDDHSIQLCKSVGALTVFFQRYSTDTVYREVAGPVLRSLEAEIRDRFLRIFLPLIRRFDYQTVMHPILADLVGGVTVVNDDGSVAELDLLTAHKSAILEFKEEIVAIQLFIAVKRGLQLLFGKGARIRRSDLAFVSGVGIPCAGDVPAHFLGISPADLGTALLVHSRAIGNGALMIVDRKRSRAVRVDVVTGVLPKDKELTQLRGRVINHKRVASGREHRRFFDRLGELIVDYVRSGDTNFALFGPVPFDWEEYRSKLSFSPANRRAFTEHLVNQHVSVAVGEALRDLGVLDVHRAEQVLEALRAGTASSPADSSVFAPDQLYAGSLSERVTRVVEMIIEPVLANDGGRLDVLDIDESTGELRVRFVGSCANCPYSLLSMEQIVKPTLLAVPGVERVTHRAKARHKELPVSIGVQ